MKSSLGVAGRSSGVMWLLLLLCSNVLVFQLTYQYNRVSIDTSMAIPTYPEEVVNQNNKNLYSLDYEKGPAIALPSVQITKAQAKKINRNIYGGAGDKAHLGGFTEYDGFGVSPHTWKYMVSKLGVKSLLDVGCGRGISTSWFKMHGVDTLCVEGSHDAVEQNIVKDVVTEHDFSRGPWWPPRTVDAVWSVEFLEHVGRNFHKNYLPAFRKAALLFVTHSNWGGWHHVEVHDREWWITKFEMYGFRFSDELTQKIHRTAMEETKRNLTAPNGEAYNAQHVWLNMIVFINPVVAALPEHAHLLADHGCYLDTVRTRERREIINKECGTGNGGENETPLPKEFYPLQMTDDMDKKWEEMIKKSIKPAGRRQMR